MATANSNSPLVNGFKSSAQEEFFRKTNPKLWRMVRQKFGSYGSPRHQKMLKNKTTGR